MISDQLLSEIERQRKYLSELPENFEFPLFNVRHAVESQRASGYRHTAAAAREMVDNSLEAGAQNIHVVFDTDMESGRKACPPSRSSMTDRDAPRHDPLRPYLGRRHAFRGRRR